MRSSLENTLIKNVNGNYLFRHPKGSSDGFIVV